MSTDVGRIGMNTRQPMPPSDEALERFISGDATEIERATVAQWLSEDPARALRIESIRAELRQPTPSAPDVDAALERVRSQHEASRFESRSVAGWSAQRFVKKHRMLLAASVAVVIGIAAWAGSRDDAQENTVRASWTVSTRAGETRQITLADGSLIDMAPRSRIQYGETDDGTNITLTGMAGFTVVHDAKRQFRVTAGNADVVDIGTEFAVRSYDADSAAVVFVKSGRVSVSPSASPSLTRELSAGEGIAVSDAGALLDDPIVIGEISNYDSELHGSLAFEGRTVESVAATLSNWFGVHVLIRDPSLAKQRVTAMFNKPELQGILDAIAETTGSQYRIAGDTITFSKRR